MLVFLSKLFRARLLVSLHPLYNPLYIAFQAQDINIPIAIKRALICSEEFLLGLNFLARMSLTYPIPLTTSGRSCWRSWEKRPSIYLNHRMHRHRHRLHHINRCLLVLGGHVILRDDPLVNHIAGL